jgi:molecular chaperone GrpE
VTGRTEPDAVSGPAEAGPDTAPATPRTPADGTGTTDPAGSATTDGAAGTDSGADGTGAPDRTGKRPAPKEPERVIVRDRRKIDPHARGKPSPTGAAEVDAEAGAGTDAAKGKPRPGPGAKPAGAGGATDAGPAPPDAGGTEPPGPARPGPGLGAELEALRTELEERTRDLQRITAEYANYRKRVERDRGLVAEQVTGGVLGALLPVLDDLDRAREHGDLVGPFAAVAEQVLAATGKFGLTAFGEKGDPFDPTRHEAVAHLTSADVSEPTCVDVLRRGYLLGERLLRPAMVAVADPE